jgi:ABC-type transport system substrate-binding protein
MTRARLRCGFAVAVVGAAIASSGALAAADPAKVLRIASPDITSLDPQQGNDLYSTRIASHIFEALYDFDYFATPAKVIPNTAEALPEVTDGGKTWTMRLKKGISFADDPVF